MSSSNPSSDRQPRAAEHVFSETCIALAAALSLYGATTASAQTDTATTPEKSSTEASASAPIEQRALEGITVRSRNRIEKVQDVPISVSVISGKELDRELSYDIGGITKRAANVVRNAGNSRTFSLSIRGVGKVSQTEAQDTSVGVILDGVNLAYSPLASFDFFDVESVEVARGPQGTLLGKNSTMGAIVINTRKPSFTPDANWAITLGQRGTVLSQVAAGGPVIDDLLAWRGSLTVNKGGGAFENTYNPDQSYFDRDRVSGRLQFLLTPTPDLSARWSLDLQPKSGEYYNGQTIRTELPATYSNGASTNASVNPGANSIDVRSKLARRWFAENGKFTYDRDYLNSPNVNLDNQRPLITSTRGSSLHVRWRLGELELVSISAYRDYHFHARNDEGTPFDISKNGGGKVDAYRMLSQEFRIASKTGGTLDYQAGLLLFRNTVDFGQQGWSSGWGADAGAWFATPLQYSVLDRAVNPDGSASQGRYLLVNSLQDLNKGQAQAVENRSAAIFGQADWRLSPELTVTGGLRLTREDRRNTADSTIVDNGAAGVGLNPASINGVATGGFNSVAFSAATAANNTAGSLQPGNSAEQLALANTVANKYFGVANYAALTAEQKKQIAAAKTLRQGQIGSLWTATEAPRFSATQPGLVLSPSYKINPDVTSYLSYQYGEKGGVAQVVNGLPLLADPEKVSSLEWGVKASLLNKALFIAADVFVSDVKGYQQAVSVPDPLNPSALISYTGNADKVRIQGLEVDGAYSGIPFTHLRFSGAFTDARYQDFRNSPTPVEVQTAGVQDVSSRALTGAARFTFNVGGEYRRPVLADKVFHASFNTAFSSGYNADANLSAYGWVSKRWLSDASIGLGRRDGVFDVNLIVKNVFDDRTPQGVTWNSYTPADPRWIGVQVSGRL